MFVCVFVCVWWPVNGLLYRTTCYRRSTWPCSGWPLPLHDHWGTWPHLHVYPESFPAFRSLRRGLRNGAGNSEAEKVCRWDSRGVRCNKISSKMINVKLYLLTKQRLGKIVLRYIKVNIIVVGIKILYVKLWNENVPAVFRTQPLSFLLYSDMWSEFHDIGHGNRQVHELRAYSVFFDIYLNISTYSIFSWQVKDVFAAKSRNMSKSYRSVVEVVCCLAAFTPM